MSAWSLIELQLHKNVDKVPLSNLINSHQVAYPIAHADTCP